jgi:hypothetical protein
MHNGVGPMKVTFLDKAEGRTQTRRLQANLTYNKFVMVSVVRG